MKILYGVQGTGNGHISRSRIMQKHFAEKNIAVDYLFSGRDAKQYFDMQQFAQTSTPRYKRGLTFQVTAGKINLLATAKHLHLAEFYREVKKLNVSDYDLIISDFEPITAWAAKRKQRPCLGIGHQYAFHWQIPLAGDNFFSKKIMQHFAPVSLNIGLHWHHFNQPILPPIIDNTLTQQGSQKRKILVYLPFEDQDKLSQILADIPDFNFYQYAAGLTDTDMGNVHRRKPSLLGFKNDLCQAQGVISNAGFELLSECIHLNLAMLVKPLTGQMEQASNAKALTELTLATVINNVNKTDIQQWLTTLAPNKNGKKIPDVADALTDWIIEKKWQPNNHAHKNLSQLSQQLWQK